MQERVCSIAAGMLHSLAVTDSGAIYSWGLGNNGRLGHGDEEGQRQRLPRRVAGLQERVCSMAAGAAHSPAVTQSGALYSWGHA